MTQDKMILKKLAYSYREMLHEYPHEKTVALHRAVNDLKPQRPTVLIDELPWHEMNFDGSLTLHCIDPYLREVEQEMRRVLYKRKYLPCDTMITPYVPVNKVISSTGFGMDVKEHTRTDTPENHIVSHSYTNQLEDIESIDALQMPLIEYNETETKRRFALLGDCIGDIVPVKICGAPTGYELGCITWDIIAEYMGINDLLINMLDEPEMMHHLVKKLTDIFLSTIKQHETLGLMDADALYVHCSAAPCSDLEKERVEIDGVKAKNVWGRGLAQILTSVSPEMLDEFDIQYMIEALQSFGAVYYGCCEPLDRRMHVVEKIPNLRKVSMSPWADIKVAAEAVGKKYAISAKPNPANVSQGTLDKAQIKEEINGIIKACREHNTPCEILLKDISTAGGNPNALFEWEKIAMDLACS